MALSRFWLSLTGLLGIFPFLFYAWLSLSDGYDVHNHLFTTSGIMFGAATLGLMGVKSDSRAECQFWLFLYMLAQIAIFLYAVVSNQIQYAQLNAVAIMRHADKICKAAQAPSWCRTPSELPMAELNYEYHQDHDKFNIDLLISMVLFCNLCAAFCAASEPSVDIDSDDYLASDSIETPFLQTHILGGHIHRSLPRERPYQGIRYARSN
eukprot:TRINITY_DN20719_c0_g1_i1.p1 TRINITY_DN20719_c0_g1~~TRINITY_DN20719_c0_g1_i1.p1  ORF type:complete len:220 (+),score=23.55 TRINITY_DN20719_c0_g1_i1:34-660(+)